MSKYQDILITSEFLDSNPNAYFVFGDNLERTSRGKAALLRDHPHAIGFITKKFPDDNNSSFYRPEEYSSVFFEELSKLTRIIQKRSDKTFYISPLGKGPKANRYRIWELLVQHNLVKALERFDNVVFCWSDF